MCNVIKQLRKYLKVQSVNTPQDIIQCDARNALELIGSRYRTEAIEMNHLCTVLIG